MEKVNFLTDHLGASQSSFYLVQTANKLAEQYDVTVFYDQLQRPCRRILVPAMMLMEAWAQPGLFISTSVSTTSRLLEFPGPHKKMFYVWDLSWLKPQEYGQYHHIFRHEELTIIARCQDHARVIRNNFNVGVPYVVENFDLDELTRVIENECGNA